MSKMIIVTGASRGIGAATALLAAKEGYAVCVNYLRKEEAARQVVHRINAAGGKAIAVQANVAEASDVVHLFAAADTLGNLYGLVNNAGILETQMRVANMDSDRLSRVLTSNVSSVFLCSREAIKRMSTIQGGKGGCIVNVSSIAAKTGAPGEYVDYAASKGAVDTFTMRLSKDVAGEGIRVNGVRPGFIYTDIHASSGEPGRVTG